MKATFAYRHPSTGDVTAASVLAEYEYDGLHRRIVRTIDNSADLDHTYHDYYDGQSVVETRNGSDQVLKQHVWGVTYVDELVQVAINGEPVDDPEFDPADGDHDGRYYYALHNANYNVQLLLDDNAVVVERYEYDPYGERTVYISPGSNDPDCHAPTMLPQRVTVAGIDQPYGICEIGFQGKQHCDVSPIIFHGLRPYHIRMQKSMVRDYLGYPDGQNAYAPYHVLHGGLDPSGLIQWETELAMKMQEKLQESERGKALIQEVERLEREQRIPVVVKDGPLNATQPTGTDPNTGKWTGIELTLNTEKMKVIRFCFGDKAEEIRHGVPAHEVTYHELIHVRQRLTFTTADAYLDFQRSNPLRDRANVLTNKAAGGEKLAPGEEKELNEFVTNGRTYAKDFERRWIDNAEYEAVQETNKYRKELHDSSKQEGEPEYRVRYWPTDEQMQHLRDVGLETLVP